MSSHVSGAAVEAPRQGLGARRAGTVERLLTAGAEELTEVGHEALTIRAVASRAGVSAATAYTYFASKNHLFAELFWRFLQEDQDVEPQGATATARVQDVTRRMAERLAGSPALAAAVTPALLGSDPDVARLRLRIGAALLERFERALGEQAGGSSGPAVLEALVLAFSGALLQAGMGVMSYTDMGERLDAVVAAILEGHA